MNIENFLFNLVNFSVVYACGVVRMFYYYSNDKKTGELITKLNQNFKEETMEGIHHSSMDSYEKVGRTVTFYWMINTMSCSVLLAFLPLFMNSERSLPFSAWFPWDWHLTPWYHISYLLQLLTNFCMALIFNPPDLMFVCICFLISGQFHILGNNYKNVFYTALLRFGIAKDEVEEFSNFFNGFEKEESFSPELERKFPPKKFSPPDGGLLFSDEKGQKEDLFQVLEKPEFKEVLMETLKDCIKQHQELLGFVEEMEDFISPIMLPQMLFLLFYFVFIVFTVVTFVSFC